MSQSPYRLTSRFAPPEYSVTSLPFYGEALNTSSPAYRFLCFYKILEGLELLNSKMRHVDGENRQMNSSAIPETYRECAAWLNTVFDGTTGFDERSAAMVVPEEVLGWKLNRVKQARLRRVRDRIAHFVLDKHPTKDCPSNPDDPRDQFDVHKWNDLLVTCARHYMKQRFAPAFRAEPNP